MKPEANTRAAQPQELPEPEGVKQEPPRASRASTALLTPGPGFQPPELRKHIPIVSGYAARGHLLGSLRKPTGRGQQLRLGSEWPFHTPIWLGEHLTLWAETS